MSEYPLGLDSKFIGKTIYDPCPYGWCLPPQDTWTNFTTTENPLGAGTAKDNYVSYSTTILFIITLRLVRNEIMTVPL